MKIRKFGRRGDNEDNAGATNQQPSSDSELPIVAVAENAFRSQQWPELVELLVPWLDDVDATPQLFVWASIAHREQGDLDGAETIILAGRSRFPEASTIGIEWADIAMKRRDWPDAVARLEQFTGTTEKLSPVAYVKLAIAKSDLGDFKGADAAIAEGWTAHGRIRRLDIEYARVAIKAERWTEAIGRLRWVITNHKDAPSTVYIELALANKSMGLYEAADEAIVEGWEQHGRSVRFDLEWAQIAMEASNWLEAVRRFEWLLGHHEDLEPVVYLKLAICRFNAGNVTGADRAIHAGWAALGHLLELDLEWAALAKKAQDNAAAIHRYSEVVERHGHASGVGSYVALAQAQFAKGKRDKAIEVLGQASHIFPGASEPLVELANVFGRERNYAEASVSLEEAIKRDPAADPNVYDRLARTYRTDGKYPEATETCRRAVEQWPSDTGSLSRWAQEAMIENDWSASLQRWQAVINSEELDGDQSPAVVALPATAPDSRWHEGHWRRLADNWDLAANNRAGSVSPALHLAVADVLIRIGAGDRALPILRQGVVTYPRHAGLAYRVALYNLEASKSLAGQPAPDSVWSEAPGLIENQALRDEIRAMRVSFDSLAPIERSRPTKGSGSPVEYRQFIACRQSSLELLVKGGRFFSATALEERIKLQSEAELWPEISRGRTPLEQQALEGANEFRNRFESQADLCGPELAEAMFPIIYDELCVREPVRRLAVSIAAEAETDPVFIELSGESIEYMNAATSTEIGQLYLYQELYRLGTNVFFCRLVNQDADPYRWHELTQLELKPSKVLLQGHGQGQGQEKRINLTKIDQTKIDQTKIDQERAIAAVVASEIRSVQAVVDQLAKPLVYTTGSQPLDLAATRLPTLALLPEFSYSYDTVAWLKASDLVGTNEPSHTQLGLTAGVEGDWIDWLGEMLLPSLNDMCRHYGAEVDRNQVTQAHIADSLALETTVFAAAVKSQGGEVTLWPHSAYPTNLQARQRSTFDRVRAITKGGCKAWNERFAEVEVTHRPDLMLAPPSMQPLDPDKPLSVVVLGGRNVVGLMPFVHQAQHEMAYNKFFNGLEQIRRQHNIRIYYKPDGLSGENEAWLDRVVGQSVEWEPVAGDPLQLAVPNMIFVSVSVASPTILEGLGRGIPGLIIDQASTHHTPTIDGLSISSGSCTEVVEMVRACSLPGGIEELLSVEWSFYRAETGYDDPVIDLEAAAAESKRRVDFADRW